VPQPDRESHYAEIAKSAENAEKRVEGRFEVGVLEG